jgi:hypothetical protein
MFRFAAKQTAIRVDGSPMPAFVFFFFFFFYPPHNFYHTPNRTNETVPIDEFSNSVRSFYRKPLTSWGDVLFVLSFVFWFPVIASIGNALLCFLSLILPITTTDADASHLLFFTDSIYLSLINERIN